MSQVCGGLHYATVAVYVSLTISTTLTPEVKVVFAYRLFLALVLLKGHCHCDKDHLVRFCRKSFIADSLF